MSRQSLGFLLHVRRKKLGLKQEDVARRVGISQSALSKIERGILMPGLVEAYRFGSIYELCGDFFLMEAAYKSTKPGLAKIRNYWGSSSKERKKMREEL